MYKFILCALFTCYLCPVFAEEKLPPPPDLLAWKDWVLETHPDIACPVMDKVAAVKRCAWLGPLQIRVDENGAAFSQSWELFGENWLTLPGSVHHWPQAVTVDGKAVAILDVDGLPRLYAKPGTFNVRGRINWRSRPQSLQLPRETVLIDVSVDGKTLAWPNIDNSGRLWFKRPEGNGGGEEKGESVKVEVFRRISDGIPIQVATELRLVVAGKPRELLLGRLLLEGSEPTQFISGLPARIEPDGQLRIQVRPGAWTLKLDARLTGNSATLAMARMGEGWPEQEIWVFDSAPQIRGVKISGVTAIDASRLNLPRNWHDLPAYLMDTASHFTIEEQYRGDVTPTANQINATRKIWLDFDGAGATVKDLLTGVMYQGWRLSAQPALQLGRVSVNGEPQLVTRMEPSEPAGVEIRQRDLKVEAVSRLQRFNQLSATGWQHDLNSLNMKLNLPPGWMLWHATGPDSVHYSWLSRWDLWDLFLCLLIVGATFKLLGWRWAALAAVTLALTYHEANTPLFTWVALIIVLPLLKVLPAGRLRLVAASVGYLTLAALIVVALVFSVQQARRGLYPQLEQHRAINVAHRYADLSMSSAPAVEEVVVTAQKSAEGLEDEVLYELEAEDYAAGIAPEPMERKVEAKPPSKQKRYQPSANIQTGPGEPTWYWREITLSWSGPVDETAAVDLFLTPPIVTRVLMFLQIILVGLLVFAFTKALMHSIKHGPSASSTPAAGAAPLAALLLLSVVFAAQPVPAAAAAFPPQDLLKEYEQRLTRQPDCAPNCFTINRVHVTVSGDALRIRLAISTGAAVGVPLPYDKGWQVSGISVNGLESKRLTRTDDAGVWALLPPGSNQVIMTGRISGDAVNLPFRYTPHNVSVDAEGWEIYGLDDNRLPSRSLQLQKQEKAGAQDTLLPDPPPPFVQVHRYLSMDLDWNLRTTVTRMAPPQGGLSVNVPLLPGESVVDENIKLIEGADPAAVAVTLGARQRTMSWNSVIQPAAEFEFSARENPNFVEVWSIETSPRWHISYQGLTPVKSGENEQAAIPRWLPWPGERLQVSAVKPGPVAGATTTVESVAVNAQPGARSTDLTLQLKIRNSLGGDFLIEQPANASLERITIDGVETTLRQEGETVVIPLHPGIQSAGISWSLPVGVSLSTMTPAIKLSAPANNIDLTMSMPRSRWPLFVAGPDIGPAMLYWGVLLVILFVAVTLGYLIKHFRLGIPVNTWQWILLSFGMSTVNMFGTIFVVLWFFAMETRSRIKPPQIHWRFNLMQLGLVLLSVIAVITLFSTIPESLLSTPDMQVTGNGSHNYLYKWYQDNSAALLPQGQVYSVPIWVYRSAMLLWSLWLVFALLRWVRWGWGCFSHSRLWMLRTEKT